MEDFDPVGFVHHLQLLHFIQLAATFATVYDHLIVFDQEVELIWKRPGISAKIFFLLTRYYGDGVVIAILILILTEAPSDNATIVLYCKYGLPQYLSGLCKVCIDSPFQGYSGSWNYCRISSCVSTSASKVIMQFRVYALYNRAKWVLALTFTCFMIQIGISMALFALYQDIRGITYPAHSSSFLRFAYFNLFVSYRRQVRYLDKLRDDRDATTYSRDMALSDGI
ncbi:hypothetical protein JAAARDRAFT_195297 [Jaapia argillacea MUCL 33604]|uniref:DUF6533 domain-containing protein n=1 Tax=Jaapia argillacea MUCL 33604 TaxID=933084 RepID=A0A067PMQ4_9AGAM|nr:hypothetical protein JAAARDRAFT_195297 [Jaapia argillacea MUCL 33604]